MNLRTGYRYDFGDRCRRRRAAWWQVVWWNVLDTVEELRGRP